MTWTTNVQAQEDVEGLLAKRVERLDPEIGGPEVFVDRLPSPPSES